MNVTWRLFGTRIISFGMKQMIKSISRDNEKHSQAYARFYSDESNRKNVYVNKDVKVSVSKNQGSKQISEDEIAEDVEYEELK